MDAKDPAQAKEDLKANLTSLVTKTEAEMDPLEKAVINLVSSKQGYFYAALILQMKRVAMKMERGAMGVGFKDGQITIYYDPEWLSKMTTPQVMYCVEHECLHLVLDHLERMANRDPLLWNLAADCGVNGYLLDNPGVCQKPYDIIVPGEGAFKDLPKGKHAEWYYDQIMDKVDKYEVTLNKDGTITVKNKKTGESTTYDPNSHEEWESAGKGDQSLHKELIKSMIREAYREAKSRGTVPGGEISKLIEELLGSSRVNWKSMLRRQVAASILSRDRKSSWKRPSRRHGNDVPGHTRIRQPQIAFAIDTSGSMSDEEIVDCLKELQAIKQIYNATITVIECDAEIHKVYDLSKFTKVQTDVKGRGGTAFTPVFEYLKDKKCDVLIYATDLCGDSPARPRFKTIWLAPSQLAGQKHSCPGGFGELVQIEPK